MTHCRILLIFLLVVTDTIVGQVTGAPGRVRPVPVMPAGGGAAQETGLPLIRNYHPLEYASASAFVDNWAVLQDHTGRIFVGNTGGVLVYSGAQWRSVETSAKSLIRSLALDSTGRVYVGASDDLGYLAPDASGKLGYVSLLPQLPGGFRKFGDVRYTQATPEGTYFLTDAFLFLWDGQRIRHWTTPSAFRFMEWVNGKLYVQQSGRGLYRLETHNLLPISEKAPFTEDVVSVLLPLPGGELLVGTRSQGLFRLTGSGCRPYPAGANQFLIQHECSDGIRLPDGSLAFATRRGGLLLTDAQGGIRRVVDKGSGLATNSVHHLASDQAGGLWMATGSGVSRLETFSPFSVFDESNGLVGNIQELRRYQGRLYASTSAGLYVLANEPGSGRSFFRAVLGIPDGVLRLFLFNDRLLVASQKHLYELYGDQITVLRRNLRVKGLHLWKRDPNLLFLSSEGLSAMRWTSRGWQDEGRIPGIYEDIHTVTETRSGDLLLATRWQGTIRVGFGAGKNGTLTTEELHKPTITHYGAPQGLPSGVNRFYWTGDQLYLRVGEDDFSLFRYNEASKQFKLVPNIAAELGIRATRVYPALDSLSADWWWTHFPSDKKWSLTRLVRSRNGSHRLRVYNLNRIAEYAGKSVFLEGDTTVWFRGIEGVVRLDLNQQPQGSATFQTLIERIVIEGDSLVHPNAALSASTLPFRSNTLRFEFAAPTYARSDENEFQYWLEGYDDGWSAWTKDTHKEYTRIPEGRYVFRVRARNLYLHSGQEASYAVTILPPWYRTWPLYGLYTLLVAGVVYGIVRSRSAKLRSRNLALEKLVQERTQEISAKNRQLDEQNHELQTQSEQLADQTRQLLELDKMKSSFFANLSHEFRTPLTLVLGTLNDKANRLKEGRDQAKVPFSSQEISVMQRNAQRLLQLINQLLDLSKLDSGKMKLELQNHDGRALLEVTAASFSSLAEYRRIQLTVILPPEPLFGRFDGDKLEKILYNLLSNAFKFTPEGGQITLEALSLPAANGLPKHLRIIVRDSGEGIPADQLPLVFERFFQGSPSYRGDAQGTGIGLALTRELVQLHGGTIRAESMPGQGATFVVDIPLVEPLWEAMPAEESEKVRPALEMEEYAWLPVPQNTTAPEYAQAVGDDSLPLLLIVEDNADLRQYIRQHLEDQYRVLEADNGLHGWETAVRHVPDLIISDWMMPGINGAEVCRRVKTDERTSHIPFLLLTALATEEGKLTGLENGADDYLTKPFDARELELRVRNLVQTRRKLRERFSRELRLQPKDITVTSADEKFMEKVLDVVEAHLGDADFGVEQFGREVGLSRMQLHRKLTALTGQTTSDFIRTMRLKRAAQLLEVQAATVSEVAFSVGFGSLSYFTRSFRGQFGVNPTEYSARKAAQSQ